jgi:hypothetical protein
MQARSCFETGGADDSPVRGRFEVVAADGAPGYVSALSCVRVVIGYGANTGARGLHMHDARTVANSRSIYTCTAAGKKYPGVKNMCIYAMGEKLRARSASGTDVLR